MKTRNLKKILLTQLAIIIFAAVAYGQGESGFTFANGITLAHSTDYGNVKQFRSYGTSTTNKDEFVHHKIFINDTNKTYTGYDLEIIPQEDLKKFKLLIKPLSIKPDRHVIKEPNFTFVPLPKYLGEILVEDGDIITLDIYENPQTKEKITDFVIVTRSKSVGPRFAEKHIPKNFTIDDVELSVYKFEVKINDKSAYKVGGGASGGNVGIYLPGKGRFIFSPFPREGYAFQKIGEITNNKLSFLYNGEEYTITANSPILGNGGKWHCWVLAQPDFVPKGEFSSKNDVSMQSGSVEGFFND